MPLGSLVAVQLTPLVTDRLRLRALCEDDAEAVFGILGDEETTARVSWRQPTLETTRDYVSRRISDQREHGLSMWAVELLESAGELVGLCGFFPEAPPTVELGYVIHASRWRQGFATEAVTAAMRAVQPLPVEVYATIRPWNVGSIRVATRAGMVETDQYTDDRGLMLVYGLES